MRLMLHFIYGIKRKEKVIKYLNFKLNFNRHQEHFGTINGFRLGRLPSINVRFVFFFFCYVVKYNSKGVLKNISIEI